MIGLYFLFLVALWIGFVFLVSVFITKRLPASKWRPLFGVCLFAILLPLLFIDELIGKWQFERLCQENATIYIAPDAKGRTVYLASGTPEEAVKGTWGVPIWIRQWRHADTITGETIVSYNSLRARGGWFMHRFFLGGPIIFQENYCPANLNIEMFKKLGVNCCLDPPK